MYTLRGASHLYYSTSGDSTVSRTEKLSKCLFVCLKKVNAGLGLERETGTRSCRGFDLMWEGVRIKSKGQWEAKSFKEELGLDYMLRSLWQLSGKYIGRYVGAKR